MNIKLIFHVLALLSGIIAGACALLSSQNRIVLFIVFSLIAGIFEVGIPFLKIAIFVIPELKYSLLHFPSNYTNGLKVEGLIWEKDFKQYFLKVKNKSKNHEIKDLRIDIDVFGGIIDKKIHLQEGCDNISFSSAKLYNTGIGNKEGITRTFQSYSNNLKINVPKLYPEGYFEIKLIIKDISVNEDGLFEVSYRYFNENKEDKKWANRYKLRRHQNGDMYIDSENPVEDAVIRSIRMIPAKPLVFKKNGAIEEKK